MNKLRENIRKAVNRYINEMADQIMIDQPLEAPEYEYEPTPNNPTVQQYLDALEEWWARNHDDLYDFDNFIMALDIFEDKVKAERDNFAAEMGVDRKFIKEGIDETNLESELKSISQYLILHPNKVTYENGSKDMPEPISNRVKALLEKKGIEVDKVVLGWKELGNRPSNKATTDSWGRPSYTPGSHEDPSRYTVERKPPTIYFKKSIDSIKEEVEGETNLESELKKIDPNLVLMPNRIKYNKADDMPENVFNAVVDLLEKSGIEVNMKASTTMYDFEPGERPYYAAVYFKPNYNM